MSLIAQRSRQSWRHGQGGSIALPVINTPIERHQRIYWKGNDDISSRLSLVEVHMFRYATSHQQTIHNSSTKGHNCLLEAIAVALEDSGTLPYFTASDNTAQSFGAGYASIRHQIADYLNDNAMNTYRHDTAGPTLSFYEDYYADTINHNRNWETYIASIRTQEFLDIRCITALCHLLGNLTITVLQFINDHNLPISHTFGPSPNQNRGETKHNITIAVRENQHFYAFVRPTEWEGKADVSSIVRRTPTIILTESREPPSALNKQPKSFKKSLRPNDQPPMNYRPPKTTQPYYDGEVVPPFSTLLRANIPSKQRSRQIFQHRTPVSIADISTPLTTQTSTDPTNFNIAFVNVRTLKDTTAYKQQSSKTARLHEYIFVIKLPKRV
jgi:hypothetical protein